MKLSTFFICTMPCIASGFMAAATHRRSVVQPSFATPAKSAEEDLELTRKVIQGFFSDSATEAAAPAPAPTPAAEESKEE
jgi:hypothetical protein